MKKTILFIAVLLIGLTSNAQKFKVKKGIIYRDKVEIGKVEGSLWKANDNGANIFNLNNELIMTIKLNEYNYDNPLYKGFKWYDIKFGDSGKEVMINHLNVTTSSIPSIFKNFTKKYEFEINGKPIQNQDAIISKYDFKQKLEADIKEKASIDSKYAKILADNEIQRDRLMPIKYKTLKKDELILKKRIMQDTLNIDGENNNIIIGSFTREYKRDLGSTVTKEIEYWFMEKFSKPQGEEKLTEYYAAGVIIKNSMVVHDCNVYTFVDKKIHKVKIEDPLTAETTILNFLLDNGYL